MISHNASGTSRKDNASTTTVHYAAHKIRAIRDMLLMNAILHDRIEIAKAVNAQVIPLEQAPRGYSEFDTGAATKFVLDPNEMIGNP